MKWWIEILTDAQDAYAAARSIGLLGVLVFLALSVYAVVMKGQAWDPQAFGIGFGAAVAGMGVAIHQEEKGGK